MLIRFRSLLAAFVLFLGLGFLSCAHRPNQTGLELLSEADYTRVISESTQRSQVYDGFANTMDVSGTLLTQQVVLAQADQSARIYQLTSEAYKKEREQFQQNTTKQTEIFLSFFVPDKKSDDLHKSTTKWKIFLDLEGRRLEPLVTRIKQNLMETQSFYPHHTRWHTAYKLAFPVPTSQVEGKKAKLVMTGPLGTTSLQF